MVNVQQRQLGQRQVARRQIVLGAQRQLGRVASRRAPFWRRRPTGRRRRFRRRFRRRRRRMRRRASVFASGACAAIVERL